MQLSRRSRKQSTPGAKTPPIGKGPLIGLTVVFLLATALTYFFTSRNAVAPVAAPSLSTAPAAPEHIYSETANPDSEISAALTQATREHKRVILDFGADWCGDCQVLDYYLHQPPNADFLEKHFVLVHVWIGHMDANLGVAQRYGIPINKGVPALAVLAADGRVLYAQKSGEFEDMRNMNPSSVSEFLKAWSI
jgi:thiol:disulfide interchange protein